MEEDPRLATGVFDLLETPPYRLSGGADSASTLVTIYMQTRRELEAME